MLVHYENTDENRCALRQEAVVSFVEIFSGVFIFHKMAHPDFETVTTAEPVVSHLNSTIKTFVQGENVLYSNFKITSKDGVSSEN